VAPLKMVGFILIVEITNFTLMVWLPTWQGILDHLTDRELG
jgi:hypothetical protein